MHERDTHDPNTKSTVDPSTLTSGADQGIDNVDRHFDEPLKDAVASDKLGKDPDGLGHLTDAEIAMIQQLRNGGSQPETSPRSERTARKVSRRTLIFGALGIGALAGGGTLLATRKKPETVAAAPAASAKPSTVESPSASASPSAPETGSTAESDLAFADSLIALDHKVFLDPKETGRRQQQLGVDGVYLRQLYADDENQGAIFNQETFDITTGETILAKSPMDMETRRVADSIKNGTTLEARTPEDIYYALTPRGVLDQVQFQYANLYGQRDGDINKLDKNKASNMIAGLYYDTTSPEAKRWLRIVNNRTDTAPMRAKDRWEIENGSESIQRDTFNGEQLDYVVLNYEGEEGKQHVFLTPVESTITGPNPFGEKTDIQTYTIVKWLIVKEGNGHIDPESNLSE